MLPDLQLPLGLQPQPLPCELKLAFDSLRVSPLSSKILPWPRAHSEHFTASGSSGLVFPQTEVLSYILFSLLGIL